MLKQLMLSKKIESMRNDLTEYVTEEDKLSTRSEELESAIEEAETDEELEAVEKEVEELEEAKEKLKEKKENLEGEIKALEEELEELNSKKPSNDKRNKDQGGGRDKMEIRKAIGNYVRTKQLREDIEGFKVVDGGALIPEELLRPESKKKAKIDLTKYVREIPVKRGSGTIPLTALTSNRMYSVEELEKNPELANPVVTDVKYEIKTYRGFIPISQEAIDDSDYDIEGLVTDEIKNQELNTKNEIIVETWKSAAPKTAVGLDGIKDILNVELKQVYDVKIYASSSLFNELDKLKDKNGRYLLQDDITSASGKAISGREVVVLDDDFIGEAKGDLVAFIGDAYEYSVLFNRKRVSVKWTDHTIYGERLAGFTRFDVEEFDEDAGLYVTYEPTEGEG